MATTMTPLPEETTLMTPDFARELAIVAQEFERPPYWFPDDQERLRKAVALVARDGVTPTEDGGFDVQGSKPTTVYHCDTECPCPNGQNGKSKWCYHLTATAVYKEVLARLPQRTPSLPLSPLTPEAHLAQRPDMPQEDDDDQEPVEGEETAIEPRLPLEAPIPFPDPVIAPSATYPRENGTSMPPSDLAPVPLPGGGERSRTMGQLMGALARAQGQMQNPGRDGRNPGFKSRFVTGARLRDAILPMLSAAGIALTQYFAPSEEGLLCYTLMVHTSGEYLLTPVPVPLGPIGPGRTPIQERGNVISYARRYALQVVGVLMGDPDEDGEEERGSSATVTRGQELRAGSLRQEIEALLAAHGRDAAKARANAEKQYGRAWTDLSVPDLEDLKARITRAVSTPAGAGRA